MQRKRIVNISTAISMTWNNAMEMFLSWKKAQGLAEYTLYQYRREINNFYTNYNLEIGEDPTRCAYDYLSQYTNPYSYNLKLTYLSAFFNWCVSNNLMISNPFKGFKRKKTQPRVVPMDEEMLKKLINLPDRHTYVGRRDHVMILMALDTGMRPSEMLALNPEDIDMGMTSVTLKPGITKTRLGRVLPISKATVNAIRSLLRIRPEEWKDSTLFCSYEGQPLAVRSWENRMQIYSKKLGRKITPYSLRHNFALFWLRNGGNIFALQIAMGHSDLNMTKRYLALDSSDLAREHEKVGIIDKLKQQRKRMR